MSRTYRVGPYFVEFCDNCEKPVYQTHAVGYKKLCHCPPPGVITYEEISSINYKYFSYISLGFFEYRVMGRWGSWSSRIHIPTFKKAVTFRDWSPLDNKSKRLRKREAKRAVHKKRRQKEKQTFRDRTLTYEEMLFPTNQFINKHGYWYW